MLNKKEHITNNIVSKIVNTILDASLTGQREFYFPLNDLEQDYFHEIIQQIENTFNSDNSGWNLEARPVDNYFLSGQLYVRI